ncbi:MAG: M4 family metallopeptidase [Lapillicoccus sp.]
MSRRRSTRSALALSVALATGAATLTGVALTSSATAAPAAVPADLVPVKTLTSLLGTHAWYAQSFHGLPVLDSFYAIHRDRAGTVTSVADGRLAVPATLATSPRVTAAAATTSAASAVSAAAASAAKAVTSGPAKNRPLAPSPGQGKATLAVVAGAHPALVWSVVTEGTDGESRTLVDATTGAVREITGLSKNATGKGKVFNPNPVVALKNENITDKNDADQAVLNPAYKTLSLGHLGAGPTLVGTYARVVKAKGGLASSANHQYLFTRSSDKFEQVNAYYGIDTAQTYIQSLGFKDINNESQKLLVNTIIDDNSFYSPSADTITYGTGGVDDAEDLEVVWHEYGHAIQDAQVPGYGTSEQAGATGEGFGDYWGATMSVPTSKGFDLPCLMDWDSTSYTSAPHCIRRTDTTKTTADIVGEVHADGEIWSGALWTIHTKLGRQKANTLILESQFSFTPSNSFAQAATTTVNTARALYGNAVATTVRQAFVARKIL